MAMRELKVKVRSKTGKRFSRKLRSEGIVPAVLYGPGSSPVYLSLTVKDLKGTLALLAGSATLLTLVTDDNGKGISGKVVLIKEVQYHPLSRMPLHVDLYEVSMDRKLTVKVPIALQGKPVGVIAGGILQQVTRELLVECLPAKIPQKIDLDVSSLKIGDTLHVSDIVLPEGIRPKVDGVLTVTSVVAPLSEEEFKAMEAAAAAPAEAVQPEVITKEKKEEVEEVAEEEAKVQPKVQPEEKKP